MQIYFTRHGESQANLLNEISNRGLRHGLTRKGREQAVALAQRLQMIPITHIYSSAVLRAMETSVILAYELNLDYEVTNALCEYDCGIAEGHSDEMSWKLWKEFHDAWVAHKRLSEGIEGGETFHDIQKRFVPFIDGLVNRYRGTDAVVACVSHGGIYSMMLPLVLKNITHRIVSKYGFDYTSLIIAELHSDGLYCIDWNGHEIS